MKYLNLHAEHYVIKIKSISKSVNLDNYFLYGLHLYTYSYLVSIIG